MLEHETLLSFKTLSLSSKYNTTENSPFNSYSLTRRQNESGQDGLSGFLLSTVGMGILIVALVQVEYLFESSLCDVSNTFSRRRILSADRSCVHSKIPKYMSVSMILSHKFKSHMPWSLRLSVFGPSDMSSDQAPIEWTILYQEDWDRGLNRDLLTCCRRWAESLVEGFCLCSVMISSFVTKYPSSCNYPKRSH